MLVSLISYIDRNTLALLAPTILGETGLNSEQYGFVISAFSVAYMIGNPAWGVLLDRYGVRPGMSVAVTLWTAASAAHAFATGFWSFAAARACLGFGEGATFPGGLRTAAQTLPAHARSRGIAVAYSGGSLGAVATPIIVTPIAAAVGWRGAFWFTGFVGCAWLALWYFASRHVSAPARLPPESSAPQVRLSDPRAWAFMSAYALGALPLGFVLYGAAIYLAQARGLDQVRIGALLWIPPLGWEVGYFFWGWIADRFVKGRRSYDLLLGAAMLLSLPLAVVPQLAGITATMLELFFGMFIAAGFVILPIAYATRVFSTASAGLIAGLGAGSWSAVVAIVMPIFGRLFDQKDWQTAFLTAASFPVAGYLGWWLLDRLGHRAARPAERL
ncbi:MAG: MFS transporter [Acidobacteria bacterium]|nr:MFS transporter [Acidobacteriota bacterium]MBI3278491.1 MFS transporter [Acidobacteriota bacterium]